MEDLTLEEWLSSTQHRRDELDAFGKSPLPSGVSSSDDMDRAIQNADDAGQLLADAKCYLTQETARAMYRVRKEQGDLIADERKVAVKSEVRVIQRIVDGIAVTKSTLNDRIFAILNANRSR